MKRQVIAIDFDDVIVETGIPLLQHYKTIYGVDVSPSNFYLPDIRVWGVDDIKIVHSRMQSYLMSKEYQDRVVPDNTVEAIHRLSERYELHIVTGRSPILSDATHWIVGKHFPGIFKSIEFTGLTSKDEFRTKSEVCNQIGATILIDDHIYHAKDVVKFGVDVLLFGDYAWNQSDEIITGVRRVKDWGEVMSLLLN